MISDSVCDDDAPVVDAPATLSDAVHAKLVGATAHGVLNPFLCPRHTSLILSLIKSSPAPTMLLTKLISAAVLLLALPATAAESRQLDARLNPADRRELLVPQRRDAPAPRREVARQAPDMVTTCGTPQFKGQLQALQCTLGSNGAGKFGDLLATLSTTAGGCNYVYPLVTKAMTVLAPQDSAMTTELVGDFTCNPGLLQQYVSEEEGGEAGKTRKADRTLNAH